jgi:hypothetical protein
MPLSHYDHECFCSRRKLLLESACVRRMIYGHLIQWAGESRAISMCRYY